MSEPKKALTGNVGDEEQVKQAGTKQEQRRRQELVDMQWVLSDRRGRRVLWRIMERCGAFATVWDPNAAQMGRKAAWQELGQWVRDELTEARPETFLQMMQEHLKENSNG